MRKTLISMLAVAGMLQFVTSIQAAPEVTRDARVTPFADYAPGQSPNAGSIDDDCTTGGFPLGMLTPYMTIPADTTGLGNHFEFDGTCPGGCGGVGYYGAGAADGIAVFQVPVSGNWRFATCGTGSGGATDTSLQVRTTGACPGSTCVRKGDDDCGGSCIDGDYRSSMTAALVTGQDYFLIVDGYSGTIGVSDVQVYGPCTQASDCSDGIFCNGAEQCIAGSCAAGSNPCSGSTPICNEALDVCESCASNPSVCVDDGLFCNGPGICTPAGSCAQAGNPCTSYETCNETTNACDHIPDCQTFRNLDFVRPGNFFPQCTNNNCNTSPTGHYSYGDDVELAKHTSRKVTSYSFYTQGRTNATIGATCTNDGAGALNPGLAIGDPYSVSAALYTVAPGSCLPDALIPGTACTVASGAISGSGTNADIFTCNLVSPVTVPDGTDIQLCFGECTTDLAPCLNDGDCLIGGDTCNGGNVGNACLSDLDCGAPALCFDTNLSQCGIDFYIVMNATLDGAGISIGCTTLIGGPGIADDVSPSRDLMVFANCGTHCAAGSNLGGNCASDLDCPGGGAGSCRPGVWEGWRFAYASPGGAGFLCPADRGNFRGEYVCTEPTGGCCDGLGGCSIETQADCLAAGGTYTGDMQVDGSGGCDANDGDGDGVRDECDLCPQDPNKTAPGVCGCGNADTDTDGDGTADCIDDCPLDPDKTSPGQCGCGNPDTDSDGDLTADCNDNCPQDPNKVEPLICGCGNAETGDSDGDGYSDCVDQCPGVDDDVFFPGCVGAIPTVNEWGLVVLALLLLAGAKVYFGRRTAQA